MATVEQRTDLSGCSLFRKSDLPKQVSGCMVVGHISDKVNVSVGMIGEGEVSSGSFVPGIRHIPQTATVFKKMGRGFVFLFEVDGFLYFLHERGYIVFRGMFKTQIGLFIKYIRKFPDIQDDVFSIKDSHLSNFSSIYSHHTLITSSVVKAFCNSSSVSGGEKVISVSIS